jgi:hypothetical protein
MGITQVEVDQCFQEAEIEWKRLQKESGLSKNVFMITRDAIVFLAAFAEIRTQVLALGLTIPELEEGITITEHSKE